MYSVAILVGFAALVALAIVQLFAPSLLQCVFRSRKCPFGFLQSAAIAELVAAVFLIVPETRIWGLSAMAGVLAACLVIMVYNRRFVLAVAAAALLLMFVPLVAQ